MSSEKYEYKLYQNFVVTWEQFRDSSGRNLLGDNFFYIENGLRQKEDPFVTKPGDLGFNPFESFAARPPSVFNVFLLESSLGSGIAGDGKLNLFFDVNLNPPKTDPKKIVVKNISSSFCGAPGNSFSLSCPGLFKYPIQFLDSLDNSIVYEEYKDSSLPQLQATFNLKRLSGTNPQLSETNGIPYVANPSLNFTIVYEYF